MCWASTSSMCIAARVWFTSNTPLAPSTLVLLPRMNLWPKMKCWKPPLNIEKHRWRLLHLTVLSLTARAGLAVLKIARLPPTIPGTYKFRQQLPLLGSSTTLWCMVLRRHASGQWRTMHTTILRDVAEPLAQSWCRSPVQTKLMSSNIFLLLSSTCRPVWYFRIFYANFEFNCTIWCRMQLFR
jgi:hypothetical protein